MDIYPPEAIEFFKNYHIRENILKDLQAGYRCRPNLRANSKAQEHYQAKNVGRVFIDRPITSWQNGPLGSPQELERKANRRDWRN